MCVQVNRTLEEQARKAAEEDEKKKKAQEEQAHQDVHLAPNLMNPMLARTLMIYLSIAGVNASLECGIFGLWLYIFRSDCD